jgi:cell division protein FtsB
MSSNQGKFTRKQWRGGPISGRSGRVSLLLGLGLFLWIILGSEYGVIRHLHRQQQRVNLENDLEKLKSDESLLIDETRLLEHDPIYREKIAREEWGFKRPGERVYHVRRSGKQS